MESARQPRMRAFGSYTRVWEVEGKHLRKATVTSTSKSGLYLLDEDTMVQAIRRPGTRWSAIRSMMLGGVQLYDHEHPYIVKHSIYDFNKGMLWFGSNDALNGGLSGSLKSHARNAS